MRKIKNKIKCIKEKYPYQVGLFYFFGSIILVIAFFIKQVLFS